MNDDKLILLATLGLPGSGKTHFSRLFADAHDMVHLNSDKIRHEMFDNPQYTDDESEQVFERMYKTVHDALAKNKSIIFDSNAILKTYRDDLREIADKYSAQYCLLWFAADEAYALEGIQKRRDIQEQELKQHHVTLDEDVAKKLITNINKKIEKPQNEPYIKLDATKDYDELAQFVEQKLVSTTLKAIIFDWHGVLDMARLRYVIDKLAVATNINGQEIRDKIADLTFPWNTGRISLNDFWEEVGRRFNLQKEQTDQFRNMIMSVKHNDDLWTWLPELKKQYKLAILSNSDMNKTEFIHDNEDLAIFDEVRFSSDSGHDKSQDEFFMELAQALNVQPSEALFVDDTTSHIEKAKTLGFQTCLFHDIADLQKCLQ